MRNPLKRKERGPDFGTILGDYEPPSFPVFVAQALDGLADPDFDMSDVAAIVMQDPGASARVLRVVNSAGFGLRGSATSVHQAATLLGRHQLEATLISIGAKEALPSPTKSDGFDGDLFWAASSKRATLASMIATHIDPTRQSENFTAALLQEMGVPVLAARKDHYGDLLARHDAEGIGLLDLEMDAYGWHHGHVAAWLGRQWGFPQHYLDLFDGQHDPTTAPALVPAHIVASMRDADDSQDEVVVAAGETVGIDPDLMRSMLVEAEERASEMASSLS